LFSFISSLLIDDILQSASYEIKSLDRKGNLKKSDSRLYFVACALTDILNRD
jgi:hypothetical protein